MKDLKTAKITPYLPWQDYPEGLAVNEPATSVLNKTGPWRTQMPVFHEDQCKQCLLCAPYCPDCSIPVQDGRRLDFLYDYCKGCGICAQVCPFHAIEMKEV